MDIYENVRRFYESVKTKKRIIGKTWFGRDIFAVKLGEGSPVGIAQYAMHAREYITARLAQAQYALGGVVGSIWLLPLVNPDGALLCQRGIESVPQACKDKLLAINGSEDFSLWKANGRGVDLNVNFPAKWGKGVQNVRVAGRENYIGERPFSERETVAIKKFTQRIKPDYTVSYHTKGEEVYWYFHQSEKNAERDVALAEALSRSTGYPLKKTQGSVGGYKDWCIQRFKIPAFTVEVGKDNLRHPLNESALEDIIQKNGESLCVLSETYGKVL